MNFSETSFAIIIEFWSWKLVVRNGTNTCRRKDVRAISVIEIFRVERAKLQWSGCMIEELKSVFEPISLLRNSLILSFVKYLSLRAIAFPPENLLESATVRRTNDSVRFCECSAWKVERVRGNWIAVKFACEIFDLFFKLNYHCMRFIIKFDWNDFHVFRCAPSTTI